MESPEIGAGFGSGRRKMSCAVRDRGQLGRVWRELARDRTLNFNPQPRTRGFIAMRQAPKFQPGHRQAFLDEDPAEAM